jgi:hypothetical protein
MSSSLSVSSLELYDDDGSIPNANIETIPEKAVSNKAPTSKLSRWLWMELHVIKDVHGSTHDSYPFLLDSIKMDKALIRNLLVYHPFLQKEGKQTTAWTNVVNMTFETKKADETIGKEASLGVLGFYEEIPRHQANTQFWQ